MAGIVEFELSARPSKFNTAQLNPLVMLHKQGKGPGRFWGVYGLKKATATAEIGQDTYLTARRIIRRWSRTKPATPIPAADTPPPWFPAPCNE